MSAPLMDFQPVLLWTDALLFVLIGLGLLAVIHVRGQPPLREAWRKVGKRPTGMAAATVLLAFLAVGVLDSLHYRPLLPAVAAGANTAPAPVYSTEVLSALDALLTPLRAQTEKTYSAPFAWTLYQREAMELPDGRQVRDYPRLIHGAAHLDAPAEARAGDVVVAAAGTPPGEIKKGWDASKGEEVFLEFGFSCMGHEIPAGIGVRLARPDAGEVYVVIGDGTLPLPILEARVDKWIAASK